MNKFSISALFILLTFVAAGQQNAYISYNTNDGLAQSQVRAIAQDQMGYLWLGTLGGLSRFDGKEFKNFSREDGLPDNQINCLLQGSEKFWIGTTGAVCWINGRGISSIPFPESLSSAKVLDIIEAPDGGLWMALSGEGLLYWDGSNFAHFTTESGLPDNYVRSLDFAPNGDLWIGTRSGLVVHDGELIQKSAFDDLEKASVSDLLVTHDGVIYVCTFQDKLFKIYDREIDVFTSADGLLNGNIRCAAELPNGDVWLGSSAGLNLVSAGQISAVREVDGLPYANIKSFGTDREGNLWIGTDGQGALRQAGKSFKTYSTEQGMPSEVAMDLTRLEDGRLIAGTYDQGLTVFDGKEFSPFERNEKLPGKTIWKVEHDSKNTLWVGTSSGLYIEEDGISKTITSADGLPGNRITALYSDSENMWVGAENGVSLIDSNGEIKMTFSRANGFEGKRIRSIIRQGDKIWMGAEGKLISWDNSEFKSINVPDRTDAAIYCIEVDPFGKLWVGTAAGLYVLEEGTAELKVVPFSANFSSRNINFMATLEDNTLLLGTNNGLYRLDLQAFDANQKIRSRHYTAYEGLNSTETNQNAVYVDDETVWFGTTMGLVKFQPYLDNFDVQVAPKANITGIQLFLQDVAWEAKDDSISPFNGLPVSPVLKHSENYVSFSYTGIYFNNPEKVKYLYKLEGADGEWLGPTKSRTATYAYLPHGDYTFKLRAYSDDEPDLVDEVSFGFSIKPPFYLTSWFFALCIALLLLLLYAIYQNRIRKERDKRNNLQLQFQSRMLELESQTLNSSMNRHFIFNALNSIQYYINMQDKRSANRYLTSFAKLIRMNLDSSQQTLTKLEDELSRLELYLSLEQMRFQGRFDYTINIEPDIEMSLVEIPSMMLQPFLENSIWHGILPATKHGEITIDIRGDAQSYRIQIDDNGIGVEASMRAKPSNGNGHISKGMEITQGRILLYKKMTGLGYNIDGPFDVKDSIGATTGTRVIISLPKQVRAEYKENSSLNKVEI
jgi:ligand-binding sensor domain-containing protein